VAQVIGRLNGFFSKVWVFLAEARKCHLGVEMLHLVNVGHDDDVDGMLSPVLMRNGVVEKVTERENCVQTPQAMEVSVTCLRIHALEKTLLVNQHPNRDKVSGHPGNLPP
jgi:hypothetical protein